MGQKFATLLPTIVGFSLCVSTPIYAQEEGGLIKACANKRSGGLRYVSSQSDCKRSEIFVFWNQEGLPGVPGADGTDGTDGINCWDLNENGIRDVRIEDLNGDGVVNVYDCHVRLPRPKFVFVTAYTYIPANGGLAGADLICHREAHYANLPGNYKAWLSDSSIGPSSRLDVSINPYVLPDGSTIVADDWQDLTDGNLDHAINQTADGNTIADTNDEILWVWTSTLPSGQSAVDPSNLATGTACDDWHSVDEESFSTMGIAVSSDNYWTAGRLANCNSTARFYCIEQN